LLVLGAASVILLPFLEVEGVADDGALYAHRIFGHFATALRTSSWVPTLVALGLTTGFLHYWLDRAVYRFSSPRAREAARGLLAGVHDGDREQSALRERGRLPVPCAIACDAHCDATVPEPRRHPAQLNLVHAAERSREPRRDGAAMG